ncbi:NAD(P)-binding protein [Hymenopellis radicata]|nr:NAD(P)-binding protein [Hymenopellis radicata]
MPSESRTIALFGYGAIGKPIAEALAKAGATVVIFSRDPSKLSAVPRNAKLASVDYNDETKLAALLKENSVDVVVSTLTTAVTTTDVQVAVARAAKEAGVKLFLPSEFGLPTAGHTGNTLFAAKNAIAERIRELLPTARICTGFFPEFLPGIVSNPAKPGEFVIAGNGDARFSLTSTSDIAGYVAHILTALPLSDLENSVLLIEGQSMSLNEAAALYNKKPTYISLESLEEPSLLRHFSALDAGWARTGFDMTNPTLQLRLWKRGQEDPTRFGQGMYGNSSKTLFLPSLRLRPKGPNNDSLMLSSFPFVLVWF